MSPINFSEKANLIWSVADLLRGTYRPNQYKDVMLPLVVLRRLDCVLEPTKAKVLDEYKTLKAAKQGQGLIDAKLVRIAGLPFYNTSKFNFEKLKGDPTNIAANLVNYMKGFSDKARTVLDSFRFEEQIDKLDKSDRLFMIVSKFADIDLHPSKVSNIEMGYVFEELIRRFSEASNEEAGDHFTPREVIRLMVDILFETDSDILTSKGIVKTILDPAMGTGGMLSVSQEYLHEHNPDARLEVFGQDYNDQSYAISGSDMMIKGQNIDHIIYGDSFTEDGFVDKKFDYMLANPPFGVEWKPEAEFIQKEYEEKGFAGRFGAGLPRINDGSFLFLQHLISKMKPVEAGGSRIAIVFNGSPLFTGSADSGESNIRRWIIENDWLEAIIALPDQLFYNTGISTYIWIISNRKEIHRKGKIQLIDATTFFIKMRKALGNKRNEIDDKHREEIVNLYAGFRQGKYCKIFPNTFFGYNRITVERPLKLNFCINDERIERVKSSSQFIALVNSKKRKDIKGAEAEVREGQKLQESILKELQPLKKTVLVKNQDSFKKILDEAIGNLKLKTPLYKAILDALSERDETADVVIDSKGKPVSDSELRDNETVPLDEKIDDYMKREVLPYVADAWVDEEKTQIGYEIPISKLFYQYSETRPVDSILQEIKTVREKSNNTLNPIKVRNCSQVKTFLPFFPTMPEGWRMLPLFCCFTENKTKNENLSITNVLSLSYGRIVNRNVDTNFGLLPESFDSYQIIDKDYIILRLTDLQNDKKSLRVGISTQKGIITSAYVGLKTKKGIYPLYVYYLLTAYDLKKVFYNLGGGVRQALKYQELKRLVLILPALDEQKRIANFLEKETMRIESIIKEKEKEIELLREYRSSLIVNVASGLSDVQEVAE